MTKFDSASPYIATYVLLKKDGKVLFILRSNTGWMDGKYGLTAGKVEKGEAFEQAAVREAKEEAGVTVDPKDLKYVFTAHRFDEQDSTDWVDVFFETTKWQGEPYNAEPHVHEKIEWFDPKTPPENTIPMIKFALKQIEQGKTYAEYGWAKS